MIRKSNLALRFLTLSQTLRNKAASALPSKTLHPEELEFLCELLQLRLDDEAIRSILGVDLRELESFRSVIRQDEAFFKALSRQISVRGALEVLISQKAVFNQHRQRVYQIFAYPIVVFMISLTLGALLGIWILPKVSLSLNSLEIPPMKAEIAFFQFLIGFEGSLISLGLVWVVFRFKKRELELFRRYGHLKILKVWRSELTYHYLLYFIPLLRQGLNLGTLLEMMRSADHPIIRALSKEAHQNLREGMKLDQVFNGLDPGFERLFKIEESESGILERLEKYALILNRSVELSLKRMARGIQAFAYLQVSLVVLATYSMMFAPLQLLQGGWS